MRRRILLIAGTFAILVLAYLVYDFAGRGDTPVRDRITGPEGEFFGPSADVSGLGQIRPGSGPGLVVLDHDEDHELRAMYAADRWEPVGQMIRVTNPRVEWYLPSGETIYISARRGEVNAAYVGRRYKVLNGELEGDVWVVVDRGRDPRRLPLEKRPSDAVRIHLEQVYFNRDELTIESDGRVELFSQEVDLLGKGMFVAWSEMRRGERGGLAAGEEGKLRRGELREFRINHGEWMCIRQGQDRLFRRMWLPGGRGMQGSLHLPARRPESLVSPPRLALAGGRIGMAGGWLLPALLGAADSTTPAPTGPARARLGTSLPAGAPTVPDTYLARFSDDIHMTYGKRYLRRADALSLVFEFKRSQLEEFQGSSSTRPGDRSAAPRPGAKPRSEPDDPLIITWSGPLVVKPFRGFGEPVEKRLDVTAEGARLELADGTSRATCRSFEYHSAGQWGRLAGSPARPVRLEMADGAWISVPQVRFDRDAESAHMQGPGTMHLPAEAGRKMAQTPEAEDLSISWERSVAISFGELLVAGERDREPIDYIRQAEFVGNVRLRQGARTLRADTLTAVFHEPRALLDPVNRVATLAAAGGVHLLDARRGGSVRAEQDFIRAERLDVIMSPPETGKIYPRWVMAEGKVSACQKQIDLKAAELTVAFVRKSNGDVEPERLDAAGQVEIVDRSGLKPVIAEADSFTTDPVAKTATLAGKPAKVIQEDYYIEGPEIFIKQSEDPPQEIETASVSGAGKFRFYAEEDLSGNKSEEPIPVQITWRKALNYDGGSALIEGAVELKTGVDVRTGADPKTGGDSLACETLYVQFESPPKPDENAASTPQRPGERPPTMQEKLRSRKIDFIRAEKKVLFQSVRKDDEGFLLSRNRLWSDKLLFFAADRKIKCPMPGGMTLEDYREPEEESSGRGAIAKAPRPSQTGFEWTDSMVMQEDRDRGRFLVTMSAKAGSGKVSMFHRTGRELAMKDKLNVRPWGKLPAGRNTVLHCQNLLAEFGRGKEPTTTAPAGGPAGPRVGPLELFNAEGGVIVRDTNVSLGGGTGRADIACHRIFCTRTERGYVANIMGIGRRLAEVSYWDETAKAPVPLRAPLIIWNLDTNSFRAVKAEVIGAR